MHAPLRASRDNTVIDLTVDIVKQLSYGARLETGRGIHRDDPEHDAQLSSVLLQGKLDLPSSTRRFQSGSREVTALKRTKAVFNE